MRYIWYIKVLNKELQRISLPLRKRKKFVDKLVKVHLKNGEEKWILLHIEVQGQDVADFNERMFIYFYHIFDKYRVKIVSLGVITIRLQEHLNIGMNFLKIDLKYSLINQM